MIPVQKRATSATAAAVVTEVKSAALVWIVLHVFVFIVMVAYRQHTQHYYLSQAAISQELANEALESAAAVAAAAAIQVEATKAKKQKRKSKKKAAQIVRTETRIITNINPLEQYEEPMQRLSKDLSETQESIRIKMDEMRRHMETLKSLEQKSQDLLEETEDNNEKDESSEQVDVKSALNHWRGLMSVGSLREIPNDELKSLFLNATEEIRAIVKVEVEDKDGSMDNNSNGNNKLIKQFTFDTSLSAAIVKEPSEFVCPTSSTNLLEDKSNDNKQQHKQQQQQQDDAAYETDLQDHLKKFEENFGNRIQARGIYALLPESFGELEDKMKDKIGIIFEDILELADELEYELEEQREAKTEAEADYSSSSSSTSKSLSEEEGEYYSSCIDRDLVASLVTAGLNAQIAHGDVREALRKTILRLDAQTSEEELILDADLNDVNAKHYSGDSSTTTYGSGGVPILNSVNVRTMIDSPLLMKSIDWIDIFVDAIGGYSDELDQYLDSLTGFHGTTSVGEIMVENILEQAGRVGEVDIQKYIDKVHKSIHSITGKR